MTNRELSKSLIVIKTKNGIDLFDIQLTPRTENILKKNILKVENRNGERYYYIRKKDFKRIHFTQKVLINYFLDIIDVDNNKPFLESIPKLRFIEKKDPLSFLK